MRAQANARVSRYKSYTSEDLERHEQHDEHRGHEHHEGLDDPLVLANDFVCGKGVLALRHSRTRGGTWSIRKCHARRARW